jgi:hypothetical protein
MAFLKPPSQFLDLFASLTHSPLKKTSKEDQAVFSETINEMSGEEGNDNHDRITSIISLSPIVFQP